MTALETLEACRKQANLVHLLAALVDVIKIPGNGARSCAMSGMPRGGNDNIRAAIERLEYADGWLTTEKRELEVMYEQVKLLLTRLDNTLQQVLWLYYADAMNDAQVAQAMGYHFRQTAQDKRSAALALLKTSARHCTP